jgi:hypothetical protein
MTETEIVRIVKSKIETHREFKTAYNKQLAFDFNMLNFFNLGENKITEILAFFLNPKETHGQGDIFLKEFLKNIYKSDIETNNVKITTEFSITDNRRIDLYIEFKDFIIAIENKIWAIDQQNQLIDYATFLEKKANGKYLLLYLSPYKKNPSTNSIEQADKQRLESENKFKNISYSTEIFELLKSWQCCCEAENVAFFIKQLRLYFKTKFIGNNTLNMTQEIKDLVFDNQIEVETLVKTFKEIEDSLLSQIDEISSKVSPADFKISDSEIKIKKEGPFFYEGRRVVKIGLSKGNNILWIQLYKDKLNIAIGHYFENLSDADFREKFKLYNDTVLSRHLNTEEIENEFREQVNLAINAFNT